MHHRMKLLALALGLVVTIPVAMAQSDLPTSQISIGGEFGLGAAVGEDEAEGSLVTLEWEFKLAKSTTLAARLMAFDYEWNNDEFPFREEEDGDGIGIGAEIRWYLTKEAFAGFWLAGGLGLFDGDWVFQEDVTGDGNFDSFAREEGDDLAVEAHFGLGYTFRFGRRFALAPTFIIGNYESDSPETGVYAGLGLRFSFGI